MIPIASALLRRFALAMAAAAALMLPATPVKPENHAKVIKIAIDLAFSGSNRGANESLAKAVELAIKEANIRGLPGGYLLEPTRFDQGAPGKTWDAAIAEENARANVADRDILAVFGPGSSTPAKAEIPILNAAELAIVAATTTNPDLTKGPAAAALRTAHPDKNNFFRVCGTDDLQGPTGAQLVLDQLGVKRVFVIDDGDAYGISLTKFFEQAFTENGGSIVAHDKTEITQRDYRDVVAEIKKRKPGAVYFGAFGIELGILRKAMWDAGVADIPLVGGDAMADSDFAPAAGPAVANSYYTVMTANGLYLDTPQGRQFAQTFERAYAVKPLAFDTGAYAAAQVEIAAIRSVLERNADAFPTRDEVRAAVARTHDLTTALGSITFTEHGDTRNPYVSYYTYDKNGLKTFVKQFPYRSLD